MRPILFNTEMVRAILEGRKTVTRRVVKGDTGGLFAGRCDLGDGLFSPTTGKLEIKAPYQVNDILYVRETWLEKPTEIGGGYFYKATAEIPEIYLWKPSIHMPKEAARLFLRVTDVTVEKLRDMELVDFLAEGIILSREELKNHDTALYKARELFKELWNSTCGKKATPEYYAHNWYGNPYVWVIEFEVISKEEALAGSSSVE